MRPKIKFCLFAMAYLPTKILPTQNSFWPFRTAFFFFFLNGKFTMITLNSRANRPEQKVQTQIRLLQGDIRDIRSNCMMIFSVVWVFTVTVVNILLEYFSIWATFTFCIKIKKKKIGRPTYPKKNSWVGTANKVFFMPGPTYVFVEK